MSEKQVITITRSRIYPLPARPGPAWYWVYNVDVVDTHAIGTFDHLGSLLSYLKRRYPGCSIVKSWQTPSR